MIKFFRHIRRSLIQENKMGKYFKYAIGEILLVVIGILIALQINNWNEKRKANEKQKEVLFMLRESLVKDLEQFEEISSFYSESKQSIDIILDHLENNLAYSDSLPYHFFKSTTIWEQGSFKNGVYENLKSNGFDLITNKQLSKQIVTVFDELDPWMETWEKRYVNTVLDSSKELYQTRFTDFWNGDPKDPKVVGSMYPTNYDALKNDEAYLYSLKTQRNLMGWLVFKTIDISKSAGGKLLNMIDNELKELD